MARHRNVRGYNYDDDFDDEDLYGHSVEDDYGISPATAAQFIYSKRDRHQSFTEPLEEENEDEDMEPKTADVLLSSADQARLYSCLDHMREILGESVAEQVMIDAILQCKFDHAKALDLIFQQDCNKNIKATAENIPSSGRSSKEAVFLSLQKLVNDKYKLCPLEKCEKSTEGFSDICINTSCLKFGLTPQFSVQPTEDTFSNISSNFSLSTLLSNSPEKRKSSFSKLSDIGLQELISDSKTNSCMGGETHLIGSNYSDINCSCCAELLHAIPGLTPTRAENAVSNSLNCSNSTPSDEKIVSGTKLNWLNADCCQMDKGADLSGSLRSVLCNTDNRQMPTIGIDVPVTKYGSKSLADLIQEHNEVNPVLDLSLAIPLKKSINHKVLPGCLYPLSPLADPSATKFEIPLLTTSLSSLAVSESFDAKKSVCSLSELIADDNKSVCEDQVDDFLLGDLPLTVQNIDLAALINNPTSSDSSGFFHPRVVSSERIKAMPYKRNTLRKKVHLLKTLSIKQSYCTKNLNARPSAFALSLCFNYIPKTCKKYNALVHQNQLYNLAASGNSFLSPVLPFDFQTPSPDDIVKESQKKAFVR